MKELKGAVYIKHPNKHVVSCSMDLCNALICAACGLLEHAGHTFSPLAEVAESSRAVLVRAAAQATTTADASLAAVIKVCEDCAAFVAGKHELVKTGGGKVIWMIEQMMAMVDVTIDTIVVSES